MPQEQPPVAAVLPVSLAANDSEPALRILSLDDDTADAAILQRHLEALGGPPLAFTHCPSPEQAARHLAEQPTDLIFLDYDLGTTTGSALLRRLRNDGLLTPVIVITGQDDPYIVSELARNGADAYIAKRDLNADVLRHAIESASLAARERRLTAQLADEQRRAARQIAALNQELARTGRLDTMTGLLNRGAWEEAHAAEHERTIRCRAPYAIIMLDLDHFKLLNDSQGHQAGDEVLQAVADAVSSTCRRTDFVGRYGGEEFVILLPDTPLADAAGLAERIRLAIFDLKLPHHASHVANRVTASLGVAAAARGDTAEAVVERADRALYDAKDAGRNCVHIEHNSQTDHAPQPVEVRRILVVDDDPGDVELLRRQLERVQGLDFDLHDVRDLDAARDVATRQAADVIFLDYVLGGQCGLEVLKGLRAAGYFGPIICLTGHGDEKIATDLMRHGADDYLVKADVNPDVLRRALENASTRHDRRTVEAENRRLLAEVSLKNEELAAKNRRLAELYDTAHEFVDNVSHEFRTPLTVIKEFTAIIADGLVGPTTDEQREYLGTVLNRVDDLAIMIDDMLDISKLESGQLGVARLRVPAAAIFERVGTTLTRKAAASEVTLHLEPGPDLPDLYCDPEKIGRVLINLCINAFKFSHAGGDVRLWSRLDRENACVHFGVTDNGRGIGSEDLALIFERFKQVEGNLRSSTRGFGLGLSIVRELVHLSFGDIEVRSEPGRGSTFSFTVPIAEPAALIRHYVERVPRLRNGSTRVSLIEARAHETVAPHDQHDGTNFLQHQLRRGDLLFSVDPGHWILVVASSLEESAHLADRVITALNRFNRNRPEALLPALGFELIGDWDVADTPDEFAERFLQVVEAREPDHA